MITFTVSDPYYGTMTPKWWNTFSHSVFEDSDYVQLGFHAARNAKLAKYGGKFFSMGMDEKKVVSFEHESDATFFILQWS